MADTIWLQRPSGDVPWGFRISGGRDYQEPVKVSRVTGGSIASTGLANGDILLRIGDADTSCLTQAQANDIIKNSGNLLQLCVSKGGDVHSSPAVTSPGVGQVADTPKHSGAVHDLFLDMYRSSEPGVLSSLPDSYKQTGETISSPKSPTSPPPLQQNIKSKPDPAFYTSSPKADSKQPSTLLSPRSNDPLNCYDSSVYKKFNLSSNKTTTNIYNQNNKQGNVYRNYKPETSLNSSTDSGVSLGQNSNLSSYSLSNPEQSSSSASASETSDTSPYTGESNSVQFPSRDTSTPSPPPPPIVMETFPGNITNGDGGDVLSEDQLPSFPPPPPPEDISSNAKPPFDKPWKKDKETVVTNGDSKEYPTRLNEQLSSMNINNYNSSSQPPSTYSPYSTPGQKQVTTPHSPYTPSYQPQTTPHTSYTPSYQGQTTPHSPYTPTMRGYQSPSTQQHQNYQSPGGYHSPTVQSGSPGGYHPLANAAYSPPAPPPPPPPMENSYSPQSRGPRQSPKAAEKPMMPDAVLNMAAKGQPDKKPFAYAADMNEIKEHREKVRRKPVGIPSYQNILNLPQFDDKPISRPYNPAAPNQQVGQTTPTLPAGPGEGVYTHAQYNTPIGLYSDDSAQEAFRGQTDGVITNVQGKEGKMPQIRLPGTKETCDITQSETYKMIHGIGPSKGRPKIVIPAHTYQGRQPREPAPDDEMTFSGVNHPCEIPSKSFHRLQSMTDNGNTGGSEVDTTSLRHQHHLGDDEVGGYDEASIRYLGNKIPSRSFQMLQSMTGGADQPIQAPAKRRPVRRREEPPQQEEKHDDEIVDISYVGGNIPSRSFKMLQQSIGEPHDNTNEPDEEPGNTVRVQQVRSEQPKDVPQPVYHEQPTDNRRQRRRQRNKEMHDSNTPERQFDENSYLSGNVQIVSGSVNKPRPRTQLSIDLSRQPPPQLEPEEQNKPEFDEQAFLTGRVPLISGESKPWSPKKKEFREKAPWETEEDHERPADLFQEEPFRRKGKVERETAPWERPDEDYPRRDNLTNLNYNKENVGQKNTDKLISNGKPQLHEKLTKTHSIEDKIEGERAPWERSDEAKSGRENLANINFRKDKISPERAPWERSDDEISGTESLVNANFKRDKIERERAPWERSDEEKSGRENLANINFRKEQERERAPWERSNEEQSGRENLANFNFKKDVEKEKAPWERQESDPHSHNFDEDSFLKRRPSEPIQQEDGVTIPITNGEPFDESAFLKGKVPLVNGSSDDPSFHSNSSEESSTIIHPAIQHRWEKLREFNIEMDNHDDKCLCNGNTGESVVLRQEPTKGTQYKKPTAFRERAPWERPDSDHEGEGFDEKEFLMGRVPLVNPTERRTSQGKGRFNEIPSKTFHRLTRSMSRDASPSTDTTSDYISADDDDRSDPGVSTSDPRYVGHKIPSKTFLKLHRSMERRSAEPDYFNDDYNGPTFDDHISKQVEDVTIERKDPDVYLNNLKDSMQETKVKIEPQAEATDF